MISRGDIRFAIKVDECPIMDVCIFSSGNCDIKNRRGSCALPMILNPICVADDFRYCSGRYLTRVIDGSLYIFYSCKGCKFKVKKSNKLLNKHPRVIRGEELNKLLDIVYKDKNIKQTTDDYLVTFLNAHLKYYEINTTSASV